MYYCLYAESPRLFAQRHLIAPRKSQTQIGPHPIDPLREAQMWISPNLERHKRLLALVFPFPFRVNAVCTFHTATLLQHDG